MIAAAKEGPIRIAFYLRKSPEGDILSLKIFYRRGNLALSRRVPLLENLGFNVLSERTFDIYFAGKNGETEHVVLHDMELEARSGGRDRSCPPRPAAGRCLPRRFRRHDRQ